jgi:hypothetical protein
LLSRGERAGTTASTSGVTRRYRVGTCSTPMSTVSTSPAWNRPGATCRPTFGACIVTVTDASTAAPGTSPVDASTPEGTSTLSTWPRIDSICAAASCRGSPRKPVPKSASTTTSAAGTGAPGSTITTARPAASSTRAAIRPSPPFAPFPQTTAIECASGHRRMSDSATAVPARSIIVGTSCPSSARRISSAL